jgi:hypothetical protein
MEWGRGDAMEVVGLRRRTWRRGATGSMEGRGGGEEERLRRTGGDAMTLAAVTFFCEE